MDHPHRGKARNRMQTIDGARGFRVPRQDGQANRGVHLDKLVVDREQDGVVAQIAVSVVTGDNGVKRFLPVEQLVIGRKIIGSHTRNRVMLQYDFTAILPHSRTLLSRQAEHVFEIRQQRGLRGQRRPAEAEVCSD